MSAALQLTSGLTVWPTFTLFLILSSISCLSAASWGEEEEALTHGFNTETQGVHMETRDVRCREEMISGQRALASYVFLLAKVKLPAAVLEHGHVVGALAQSHLGGGGG